MACLAVPLCLCSTCQPALSFRLTYYPSLSLYPTHIRSLRSLPLLHSLLLLSTPLHYPLPLFHSPTPPLFLSPTPPLLHSSTLPLFHSSILPLFHSFNLPSPTPPLSHPSTPPLFHSSPLSFCISPHTHYCTHTRCPGRCYGRVNDHWETVRTSRSVVLPMLHAYGRAITATVAATGTDGRGTGRAGEEGGGGRGERGEAGAATESVVALLETRLKTFLETFLRTFRSVRDSSIAASHRSRLNGGDRDHIHAICQRCAAQEQCCVV